MSAKDNENKISSNLALIKALIHQAGFKSN